MKQALIFCVVIAVMGGSCNTAQSDAQKQSDLIEKTMRENSPGAVATSESGSYLNAKVDGTEWAAASMVPNNDASSNTMYVRGEKGEDMIEFQLWKPALVAGKKKPFGDGNSAGIYMESNKGLISGKTGEVEITKLDAEWVEGIFHFTATGVVYDAAGNTTPKTVEVTDGRFRIPNR